ncbi:MAG: site-2 protease family protein [Thermoguttaceae bacterium]
MDSFLIAASQDPSLLTTILTVTKAVVLVLVGVNMLILVHEWGHFIVARMCGVKCEKFYIWFDIFGWKLLKFRWGETEFGLGVLPLGGYVKMLGQEDNPGRLREELERAKSVAAAKAEVTGAAEDSLQAGATEEHPVDIQAAEAALYDPRSYLSKTVLQRMAIISAGVVMNVVFAFAVAMLAYGIGVYKHDSEIGLIAPGGAAWRADLRTGDRVVAVAGKPIDQFERLREATVLGSLDDGLPIVVQRPGVEEPLEVVTHPDRDLGAPTIGIVNTHTTRLLDDQINRRPPTDFATPAARAEPAFQPGDLVVAVNGVSVSEGYEYHRAAALGRDEPMNVTVRRLGADGQAGEELTITVAPRPMRRFGLVMTAGVIGAVQDHSPAGKAGLKAGDRITAIDGKPLGDPLTLDSRLTRIANQAADGQVPSVEIRVEGRPEPVVVPLRKVDWYELPIYPWNPPSVPSLGIAIETLPIVAEVLKGSPAEAAGIKAGDTVKKVTPVPPGAAARQRLGIPDWLNQSDKPYDLEDRRIQWPFVFYSMQEWLPGTDAEIQLADRAVKLTWYEDSDWHHPDRGFFFEPKETFLKASSLGEAVAYGTEEATNAVLMVFKFIGKVGSQQVSARMMGGPWTIVKMAYYYASSRFTALLLFLCVISANLAVINFLPIPVLDGGHMVFLTYEGIRGKPPSENVQVGLSYIGLLLLLGLMIWVFGLDLGFISR